MGKSGNSPNKETLLLRETCHLHASMCGHPSRGLLRTADPQAANGHGSHSTLVHRQILPRFYEHSRKLMKDHQIFHHTTFQDRKLIL